MLRRLPVGGSDSISLAAVACNAPASDAPNMPANRFERGAVVRCNDRTWIVWTYPRGLRSADPIALPVTSQTGPRHRSQVRLTLGGRAVLVHLLDPVSLPRHDCERIGQCNAEIVATIAASMQRAIDAAEIERRQVA